MKVFRIVLAVIFLMIGSRSFAEISSSDNKVDIGIYVARIHSLSYKNGAFTADFQIWFRWKNPKLKPYESFTVKNGRIEKRNVIDLKKITNENINYAVVDVVANIEKKWDLANFPFDKQNLIIEIEENVDDFDLIEYRADRANIPTSFDFTIEGWKIDGIKTFTADRKYNTNFGDLRLPSGKSFNSTTFLYQLDVRRDSILGGIKLLVAPIVAMLILIFPILLPATESPRVSLVSASLFTLVSAHYVVVNQLPESNTLSFAEKLIGFGLAQAAVYLLLTIYSLRIAKDDMERSRKLDILAFVCICIVDTSFAAYSFHVLS